MLVTLRNVTFRMQLLIKVKAHAMVHPGFWHVSFRLVTRVLWWSIVLFATSNLGSLRFSNLTFDGWVCVAFRACRARAATCGAEQWALNMFIPQLHTLQVTKIWSGPINEARVRDIRAISYTLQPLGNLPSSNILLDGGYTLQYQSSCQILHLIGLLSITYLG